MDEMKNHIVTDINTNEMQKFLGESININKYKISQLVISEDNYIDAGYSTQGEYILAPKLGIDKWNDMQKGIILLNE
jgi:hypothetical protein